MSHQATAEQGQSLSFCMVTTFYPPYHFGGDAMYVYRLTNELARRGHRVTVIHCVDAYRVLRDDEPTDAYPHHPGVTIHRLTTQMTRLSPLITYLTGLPGLKSPALRRIFASEDFDVIHFHNISLVGGPGILSYGRGLKLYSMHEHWLVCPMHVLWKNNREVCHKPACLRCSLAFRRPPQLWRQTGLLGRQIKHVDLFLAPSQFTIDQHRQRGFQPPIRLLPMFVPSTAAETIPPAAGPAGRPYFLFVGRLEKIKGVQSLIELFRQYHQADLVIAGAGSYAATLHELARDLPHVHFIGSQHPASLRSFYAGALALLVPSLVWETFGLITIEAFAQRTPVIAHDWGGLPEPVLTSGGGLVYQTPTELLAAITRLQESPSDRRRFGEQGFAAYQRYWSEEAHLSAYFDAIEEARQRRQSATPTNLTTK